jgi:hypothetical protein
MHIKSGKMTKRPMRPTLWSFDRYWRDRHDCMTLSATFHHLVLHVIIDKHPCDIVLVIGTSYTGAVSDFSSYHHAFERTAGFRKSLGASSWSITVIVINYSMELY